MNIPSLLLSALDDGLDSAVELTLYGRAAISLGFVDPPPEAGLSRDVDAVLWLDQAEQLLETNFWDVVAEVNARFAVEGYFISHLFCEDQVILNAAWRGRRVPIAGPWKYLALYRLGDRDLLLSKLMRNEPLDAGDAEFIFHYSGMSVAELEHEIATARVPDVPELKAEFRKASAKLLAKLRRLSTSGG